MAKLSLGIGIAGLLLGSASGFLVSRGIGHGEDATSILARTLARESTIGPSVWPLAITASASMLTAVVLPLTVVLTLNAANRRRVNGDTEESGNQRRRRCEASRHGDNRVRGAGSARALDGVGADTDGFDRNRVRLLADRMADCVGTKQET